jgi:hypothetical protein
MLYIVSMTENINTRNIIVPMPVGVIAAVDEILREGRAGFLSRDEFIKEATENLVKELKYPLAASEVPGTSDYGSEAYGKGGAQGAAGAESVQDPFKLPESVMRLSAWEREELTLGDLVNEPMSPSPPRDLGVRVAPPRSPGTEAQEIRLASDEPLLGFHNRDYPSIWALNRLARYEQAEPILFEEFLDRATQAAWYVGVQAAEHDARLGGFKRSALFPTNLAKQQSTERAFQQFAIGGYRRDKLGPVVWTEGPLFAWKAIELHGAEPFEVAISAPGVELLDLMVGLSLQLPHSAEQAGKFLNYLGEHALGDRRGFDCLIAAVGDGADREAAIRAFTDEFPEWSRSRVEAVVQGYVARSREWGLLELKLVSGKYQLTATGRRFLEGETA